MNNTYYEILIWLAYIRTSLPPTNIQHGQSKSDNFKIYKNKITHSINDYSLVTFNKDLRILL